MTIVAFMQNQWFNNPDKVRRMIESCEPERAVRLRRKMIEYALFAGCKSGRVLKKIFGDLCDDILWEEASRELGGHAASVFPADIEHMRAVITETKPAIVIAFGKIAGDALKTLRTEIDWPMQCIYAPHPAARHATVMAELVAANEEIKAVVAPIDTEFA